MLPCHKHPSRPHKGTYTNNSTFTSQHVTTYKRREVIIEECVHCVQLLYHLVSTEQQESCKVMQKKYNKERGDKIKDYNKDYYTKQREKILEKARTKVVCECGCEVQLFNMNCHKKTRKHLRLVEAKIAPLTASASADAT